MSATRRFYLLLPGALLSLSACSVHVPVLDAEEAMRDGKARLDRVATEQQPVASPLDVSAAVAHALMYNLDYRASLMTSAMAREDLAKDKYALWPQLALGAGYRARDSVSASISKDPLTGVPTLVPSTSSDKQTTTGQLQLTWNALDFGVGYLRTKQKGNALLVTEEQRRKAFQSITQEVTFAWWRALAAQRMEPRLLALRQRVESALERSRQMEELRLQGQLQNLDYRRDLLLSLKRLSALQEEVLNARSDLARLTALPAGSSLSLADPGQEAEPAWLPVLSREQMLRLALANRPELRELNYRQRIAKLEGKAAVASLMPSLTLSAGPRFDSNSFLTNNEWNEVDAQFSFNLLNLAALPAARRYGKAAEAADSLRADAMVVAVMAQLGVALRAIETDRRGWCLSRELSRVAGEREAHHAARTATSSGDELTQIRAELEAVLTGLESEFSFAELAASHALLLTTLGIDPFPAGLERSGPDEVAVQLRAYYAGGLKEQLQKDVAALGEAGGDPALSAAGESCSP